MRDLSLHGVVSGIVAGSFTATEVATAYLDEIHARDEHVRAYVHVTAEQALAAAARVDAQRSIVASLPLAGAPIALKDIFVTRGVPTTAGSRILAGWVPPYEGTHAARLAAAGAVMLGKVTMDEFAMGSSNENTPFPVPRNPWSSAHVAGGSSGGSAAAVSARLAVAALGTDTGGSIRQPASLCNLVGLKPTYGRVSRSGMVAFASSFDAAGPMTREVRDAAMLLGVLAGHDPLDATSLDAPVPDYLRGCDASIVGLRVGVDRATLDSDAVHADTRSAFEAALVVLRDAGADLVEVTLPHFEYAVATYYVLAAAEAASNLARYDGVRYGLRGAGTSLDEMYRATREAGFGPEVKRRILMGNFVLRKESYQTYYGRAQRVRTLVARDYAAAFGACDVIASPTSPEPGFRLGARTQDPLTMYLSDVFTIGANLAGLPAISIPAGFSDVDGATLPIGFQLVGPALGEETLLRVAAAHEDATQWHRRAPPTSPPTEEVAP